MTPRTNTLLLTGRPGSGKGTQAKRIAEKFGWTYFSTGDKFRDLRNSDTELGARVRAVYDSGALLPDWFATYLFHETLLNQPAGTGLVCDGYPRSLGQAQTFVETHEWLGRPYQVIDLEVSPVEVAIRMLKRSQQEHRPDSATEEAIKARLTVYEQHSAPVIDFFQRKGTLTVVNGEVSLEEVEAAIIAALPTA